MTAEDLLKPRFKVIAPYFFCPYNVGDILKQSASGAFYVTKSQSLVDGNSVDIEDYVLEKTIERYPYLFQKLEWWQERKPEEMPEYYVYSGNHGVFKTNFGINGDIVMLNFSPTETVPVNLHYCLPATEDQYNAYIQKQKP